MNDIRYNSNYSGGRMNRTSSSQKGTSHTCPFCSKQFFLADTLQSHKQQCILGKSLKRPPLKPSSAHRQPPVISKNQESRGYSKEKFRIKKLAGTGGLMNKTSGDWESKEMTKALISTSNAGVGIKASQSMIVKQIPTKEKQKSERDISSVQGLLEEMKRMERGDRERVLRVAKGVVELEYDWPRSTGMYIKMIEELSMTITSGEGKGDIKLYQHVWKALERVKQHLQTEHRDSTLPLPSTRTNVSRDEPQRQGDIEVKTVENEQFCFCTRCLGQLGFGEQIILLDCDRYHPECWKLASLS